MLDHTLHQHRFGFPLQRMKPIAKLIARQFGVVLSGSAVARMVQTFAYNPDGMLDRASRRDAVHVEQWPAQTFPATWPEAKWSAAAIRFPGEAGPRTHDDADTASVPGARGQFQCMMHEAAVAAAALLTFLTLFINDANLGIVLVFDGHRSHRANLKGQVAKHHLTDKHDFKATLVATLERLRELWQPVTGFTPSRFGTVH